MMLINRNTRQGENKNGINNRRESDESVEINSFSFKKGSTKFNISGIFKRLPSSKNSKKSTDPIFEEESTSTTSQIIPKLVVPDVIEKKPDSTARNEHTSNITVVDSHDHHNYTHIHNNQERYTSFTSECISLQNSEMTSFEDSVLSGPVISKANNNLDYMLEPSKSGTFPIQVNNNSREKFSLGFTKKNLMNIIKPQLQNEESNNHDCSKIDESNDLNTYLSETESDLNFDPLQEENVQDYKKGGYHPVSKGEVYYSKNLPNREYITLRKLGWGHFSTVWLAKSRYNSALKQAHNSKSLDQSDYFVAIKFVKASRVYLEAAQDEIKILKNLDNPLQNGDHLSPASREYLMNHSIENGRPYGHGGYKHVVKLWDDFEVTGPNGNHICMVFEILGENILNLIYRYKHSYSQLNNIIIPSISDSTTDTSKVYKWDSKCLKNTKSVLNRGLGLKSSPKKIPSPLAEINEGYQNQSQQESMLALTDLKHSYGIPLTLVRQITRQLLLAVDYIHHCGIIHTDLKPENILIEIKDIDKLLKLVEINKLSSINEKINHVSNGKLVKSVHSRQRSRNGSNCSNRSSIGGYKKSKNSITCKYDTPVRTSKPLSSSIPSEHHFREFFSFTDKKFSDSSFRGSISPKSTTSSKLNDLHSENVSIKLADLGNATFSHMHFTNQIQTRQYRSPEILLKHHDWGASTDMWSIGCIIFELVTGDYLFDPHEGKKFSKDEDHMAQIIELLEEFPSQEYLERCKLTSNIFEIDENTNQLKMKNIDSLKYWSLENVLIEKYKFSKDDIEVKLISDLILKCLRFNLDERFDSRSLLQHPWLQNDNFLDTNLDDLKRMQNNHQDIPGYISVDESESYMSDTQEY